MMFPVNRPASELTATELMNLYDDARDVDLNLLKGDELDRQWLTVKELRAEIERRMKPCDKQHHVSPFLQQQGLSAYYGQEQQYSLSPPLGAISQAVAESQLGKGGNR